MIPALLNHRGDGNKAELAVHFGAKWIGQGHPGIAKLRACIMLAAFGHGATVTEPLSALVDDRFPERAAVARASR
jgi:hypothetical protein